MLLIFRKQRLRQTSILAAKYQISPVRVLYIGVALGRLGSKVVVGAVVAGKKVRKAIVIGNVQIMPVVQPGVFELFVVDGKTHGPHQMQTAGGAGTGARHVAGVLGDAGLYQNDIQSRLVHHKMPSGSSRRGHRRGSSGSNHTPKRVSCVQGVP